MKKEIEFNFFKKDNISYDEHYTARGKKYHKAAQPILLTSIVIMVTCMILQAASFEPSVTHTISAVGNGLLAIGLSLNLLAGLNTKDKKDINKKL